MYVGPAVAFLGAKIHETPDLGSVAFINLGVNDLGFAASETGGSIPLDQTTWQNDYLTILDTFHAAYPNVHVYLTKPWKQGFDNWSNTLAGWIDNVAAARSSFVSVGDDERAWLKPFVATRTTDGIHYSDAGQSAAASAKLSALPPLP